MTCYFHLLLFFYIGAKHVQVHCRTFTIGNNCGGTIWPGILSNSGSDRMISTGFVLPAGNQLTLRPPVGWAGRMWARTGCTFDGSGSGNCSTGDCGSNQIECNGAGAVPPATLVEFKLDSAEGRDYYDVSLVDGFNMPVLVEAKGGTGSCTSTGCTSDLMQRCPNELRSPFRDGCLSACEAFREPEYCCIGEYANPNTCKPSVYSQIFKSVCPRSYSYAYDDSTSIFTCSGADYLVTFCPESMPRTSSRDPASRDPARRGVILQDDSWIASLAMGDASSILMKIKSDFVQENVLVILIAILCAIFPYVER